MSFGPPAEQVFVDVTFQVSCPDGSKGTLTVRSSCINGRDTALVAAAVQAARSLDARSHLTLMSITEVRQ